MEFVCKICGASFETASGLGRHVALTHKVSRKEYYDRFFKKEGEGLCKVCGKPTTFRCGRYLDYCSSKCANLDPVVQEKTKQTFQDHFGCEHNMLLDRNRNRLANYNKTHKEELVKKTIETNRERYKCDWSQQNPEIKKKRIDTFMKKHNVDNPSKLDSVREKIKISLRKRNTKVFEDRFVPEGYEILEYLPNLNLKMKCPHGHVFECSRLLVRRRCNNDFEICTECLPKHSAMFSGGENSLKEFVDSVYAGEIIKNDHSVLGKQELDLYVPEKNLAFEYNGLYWHSELFHADKDHHLKKTEKCASRGVRLIHIWEDDWNFKRKIVESRIKSLLGVSERIYARQCEVREISNSDSALFLEENHIQGSVNSKYRYGLYKDDELVALMTFGHSRFEKGKVELHRYCSKNGTNVVGGASKLFKHFINEQNPESVVSYASRDWSSGNLYEKLGFEKSYQTKPNYWWVKDKVRIPRFSMRKSELKKQPFFDPSKSEFEMLTENGYYRIFDTGSLRYEWKSP